LEALLVDPDDVGSFSPVTPRLGGGIRRQGIGFTKES
jgi:hypothetical protein